MRNLAYNQDPREYDREIDGYELSEAEEYEACIRILISTCLDKSSTIEEIREAAEDLKAWLDESDRDDPRANGWVGQDGRP